MSEKKMLTLKMYVHKFRHHAEHSDVYLYSSDMSDRSMFCLGETEVTFSIPEKDPVVAQVESLEDCIQKLQAETHIKVTNMKEQIQSLLAITHCSVPIDTDYPF